jgi:hypothetical protein
LVRERPRVQSSLAAPLKLLKFKASFDLIENVKAAVSKHLGAAGAKRAIYGSLVLRDGPFGASAG